ncbi:unnamed protein product [Adineta steineri]|uniref:Uncharacterized protein n=1 Tax=Adineta steineri TaxID=433720 RepID=A0A815SBG6_9BILA|nr:unnamed protein product [Adineta steineri]CAF4036552.1 unnamed protein product [Adineta steineri]
MELFDLNEEGQFVLPFSRRLIYTNRLLWPKISEQPPSPDYKNKTYADHIFQDVFDNDDDDPENGNLHLVQVHVESDDEKKEKMIETVEEEDEDDDDENGSNMELEVSSSSTTSEYFDMDNTNDDADDDIWFDTISLDPPSPFAVDPYESFDYEC